jgi:TatD DNase family protein
MCDDNRSFLVDTHAHLGSPEFELDLDQVLERAKRIGISTIIAVSETLADARRNLDLAAMHPPMVRAAAGLYPTYLEPDAAAEMRRLIRENRQRLVAIGEVGLDYRIVEDEAAREIQREIFRGFIDLSDELDLPLNIHSRSAGKHAVTMLLARGARRVQLHGFDGKAASAMPAVEAGYFFSIPPSVIRSPQKQKLVRHLPLSCLLLESDSPVLGPNPRERNEPSNLLIALETIAELKGIHPDEVRETIADNVTRLYDFAKSPSFSG